ncbi:MAG: transcriptional repressor LexA [Spirochaetota bacterium]
MSKELTDRQDEIFSFIKNRIHDTGIPPTVREIGDSFGITVKGAYDHLKAIEKKGYLRCEQNKSRSIELLIDDEGKRSVQTVSVPLVGDIAAGSPILAQENITDYLAFPKSLLGAGEYFALKVRGDSMINAGIDNGDIAVIRKQNTAHDGDIVAALLGDEATLKRLKKQNGAVQLIAENPAYKPIVTSDASILGVLAGLFRNY